MDEEVMLDGPIPGQSLTAELGSRPWQQPSQYSTVEEAIDYYVTRMESEEVTTQLLDVLEMGVPVTTVANAIQSSSVMEGKHTSHITLPPPVRDLVQSPTSLLLMPRLVLVLTERS